MPYVPIPQLELQAAAAKAPTMDVRAPVANYAGVSGAAGQLAAASEQPLIPTEPFTAAGKGLEKIGQGVDAFAQLAKARAEAEDDLQVAEGQGALRNAMNEHLVFRETADPSQWIADLKQRRESAVQRVLGNEKMSRRARHRFEIFAKSWGEDADGRAALDYTKEVGERAQNAALANADAALSVNDYKGATAIVNSLGGAGKKYINPRILANKLAEIKDAEEKAEKTARANTYLQVARTQGTDAANKLIADGTLKPKDEIERQQLEGAGRQQRREDMADAADAFEDAVALGQTDPLNPNAIAVPQQVEKWREGDPNIRESVRAQLRAVLERRQDANYRERIRANAPELSSRLMSEVSKLDPDTATDEDFTALRSQIAELPKGFKELPYSRLMRKWRKHEGEDTAEEKSMLAYGEKIMESMLRGGDFGAYYHVKQKLDSNGKPIVDTHGNVETWQMYVAEDEQKALSAKQALGGLFRRWFEKFQPTDPEAVRKWLSEHGAPATRIRAADDYKADIDPSPKVTPSPPDPAPKKPGKTAAGYIEPDLPEEPGQTSNILLPRPIQ